MNNPNNPQNRPPQTPPYQQYPRPQEPHRQSPSGGELFVGLNILSKIGVVFIILGVIAFAAVSEGYLPPMARTVMIFAVGAVMAGAGEVFYRMHSAIFARALTLGAIIDIAVSVLISYYALGSINTVAAIGIAAGMSLGGMMLAWRYKSQTVMIITLICAFLPFFAASADKGGFFSVLTYLLVIQGAAVIVAAHKKWVGVMPTGMACNFIIVICMVFYSAMYTLSPFITAILVSAYTLLSYGIYSAYSLVSAKRKSGKMSAGCQALFITAQTVTIFAVLCLMLIFADRASAGAALFMLAAIYLGLRIAFAVTEGNKTTAVTCIDNLLLAVVSLAIFTAFVGRYAYFVFHLFAAAVMVWGILSKRKMLKIWGYILLSVAEIYFLLYCCTANLEMFMWQFTFNAAVWLGLMIFGIARKGEGVPFGLYTSAAAVNLGAYASYMLSVKLTGMLIETGAIVRSAEGLYAAAFTAAAWLLLGFAAGKLRHMKKGAAGLSLSLYTVGLLFLLTANIHNAQAAESTVPAIIVTVALNVFSVAAALDMALKIKSLAPKFARAVGLVVSAYGLYALTVTLGSNKWVVFASCIISIVYLAMAALWIVFGFRRSNALLRRFGLALALLSAAKLFLFDFRGLDAAGRTLMFIGFGLTLLCISFAYGFVSRKMKNK